MSTTSPATQTGIGRLIADRKISTKIGLGFACILAITAGLSVTGYRSYTTMADSVATYMQRNDVASIAQDADRNFASYRRYAREFAYTADAINIVAAEKEKTAFNEVIARGLTTFGSPDRIAKLKDVAAKFDDYTKSFDKVVPLRRDEVQAIKEVLDLDGAKITAADAELVGAMDKSGSSSAAAQADEVVKLVQLVQSGANGVLGRHDETAAAGTEKALSDLRDAIATLDGQVTASDARKSLENFKQIAATYHTNYSKALELAHTIDGLFNGTMKEIAQSISEDTQTVKDSAVMDAKAVQQEMEDQLASTKQIILFAGAGGLLLGALLAWLIGRSIANPVKAMTEAMTKLAGGDLTADVPSQDRNDEIGEMAKAVLVFRDSVGVRRDQEVMAERSRVQEEVISKERILVASSIGTGLAKLAAKDLTYRLTDDLPEAYLKLKTDFNSAIEELSEAIVSVRSGADSINSGTKEIAQASDDLSRRTEYQAASLEETAAAVEQITATVKKTADGANHARKVVTTTKTEAEKSGEVVRKAINSMSGIEKSSKEISQIIGVIDEIAYQTNLLALNAGVEAARAGDAGRGFAVVATEVRALAQRSADAAKQIKSLISTSTSQVDEGVKLVAQTGTTLERIVVGVAEIDAVIANIAASTQEQATALEEVNTAVNQMDQVTQQNAAMVEQATEATRTLAQQSEELERLVGGFQTGRAATADSLRQELKKVVPHAFAPIQRGKASIGSASEPGKAMRQVGNLTSRQVASKPGAARRAKSNGASHDGWEEF